MASRNFLLRAAGTFAAVGILGLSAHAQLTQVETAQQLQLNTITTAVPFLTKGTAADEQFFMWEKFSEKQI